MRIKAVLLELSTLVIACLTLTSCARCLYPVARAFGGPKESDLKVIRANCAQMKRDLAQSGHLAVYPACLINFESCQWKSGSADQMVGILRQEAEFAAYAVQSIPTVAFQAVGRNQMRFMWERARAYADWVKSEEPVEPGHFIMFMDFICPPDSNCGRVGGVHVYVIDASGNISYTTLINSHHEIYERLQPDSLEDCCAMAAQRFLAGLEADVMDLYPPYGVG